MVNCLHGLFAMWVWFEIVFTKEQRLFSVGINHPVLEIYPSISNVDHPGILVSSRCLEIDLEGKNEEPHEIPIFYHFL
jgi:hypothetical protein